MSNIDVSKPSSNVQTILLRHPFDNNRIPFIALCEWVRIKARVQPCANATFEWIILWFLKVYTSISLVEYNKKHISTSSRNKEGPYGMNFAECDIGMIICSSIKAMHLSMGAFRCIKLSVNFVCSLSWMYQRIGKNPYCPAFVSFLFSVLPFAEHWFPQDGTTPLHIAAQNGSKEMVDVLLENGTRVNAATEVISDE